jgi:hypothetical protein
LSVIVTPTPTADEFGVRDVPIDARLRLLGRLRQRLEVGGRDAGVQLVARLVGVLVLPASDRHALLPVVFQVVPQAH